MQCPQCNTLNITNANFCGVCGRNLAVTVTNPVTNPVIFRAYSGFWKRFGALIIDSILLSIVVGACAAIIAGTLGVAMIFSSDYALTYGVLLAAVGYAFSFMLNWLYFTLMESSSQQATLGKIVLGMAVIDEFGGRISFARANARYWSKILSTMFLWIGYIMAAFTEKKQALHDLIATTFVVDK